MSDAVEELCEQALTYAAEKDATRGGEPGQGTEMLRNLVVIVRAQRAAAKGVWEDAEDVYTPDIHAAHPLRSRRFDVYGVAMAMISARRDKYSLIDLVNWLLLRIDKLTNVARLSAQARAKGVIDIRIRGDLDEALKELGLL